MSKSMILYHLGFLCFLFDLLVGAWVSCTAQRHKNDTSLGTHSKLVHRMWFNTYLPVLQRALASARRCFTSKISSVRLLALVTMHSVIFCTCSWWLLKEIINGLFDKVHSFYIHQPCYLFFEASPFSRSERWLSSCSRLSRSCSNSTTLPFFLIKSKLCSWSLELQSEINGHWETKHMHVLEVTV